MFSSPGNRPVARAGEDEDPSTRKMAVMILSLTSLEGIRIFSRNIFHNYVRIFGQKPPSYLS